MVPVRRAQKATKGARKRRESRTKKCGAESSDPNRHSQPRLPGSVVGEASMRQLFAAHKITKVSSCELPAMSSERTLSLYSSLVAHSSLLELFRRHQRMRNGVHRQRNAILNSDLAHQLGDVRLHRALFDSQLRANFFVGAAGHQHFQNFLLAVG